MIESNRENLVAYMTGYFNVRRVLEDFNNEYIMFIYSDVYYSKFTNLPHVVDAVIDEFDDRFMINPIGE